MKKTFPFIIIIISLLTGCLNKQADQAGINESNIITTPQLLQFPETGEDTLKTSFFADTVIYVPLETSAGSFIGTIRQILVIDSTIFISCYDTPLLMFDLMGKFIRTIGKNGRGPGEYQGIQHFDLINDTIYISDLGRRSLLRYTINDTFCDEIKFNFMPAFFNSTVDNKLACYLREEGKIFVYNKDFNRPDTIIVEHAVTQGRYRQIYSDPLMPFFQKTSSGLLFNNYLSDTVWSINATEKTAAYILQMKDKLLPYSKQIEFIEGSKQQWLNSVKTYQFVHLIPFSSHTIIFQKFWGDWKHSAVCLQNNKTKEIQKYDNSMYIYDDLVGKQNLQATFLLYSSEYLITIAYPSSKLKKLKDKTKDVDIPTQPWLDQMTSIENYELTLALIKIKKTNE